MRNVSSQQNLKYDNSSKNISQPTTVRDNYAATAAATLDDFKSYIVSPNQGTLDTNQSHHLSSQPKIEVICQQKQPKYKTKDSNVENHSSITQMLLRYQQKYRTSKSNLNTS